MRDKPPIRPGIPGPRCDDEVSLLAQSIQAQADATREASKTNLLLAGAIDLLAKELKETNNKAILHRLAEMEKHIMSAVSEFAAKQNAFNDRVDTAVTGLQGDIKALNDLITELQNSPGTITPEDQASLDALEARGTAIAEKLEALDALTPPKPPTP